MKKNFLLFLFIIFSFVTFSKEKLRVGMEAGYAPFNWYQNSSSNGAVKLNSGYANGYDVQIAKILAEKLNKELVIVQSDWDSLLGPAISSNKIDVVIAGMSPTKERKQNLDFSEPYYESDLVIIVKKGSKFENSKNIQEFKNAKLTAQLNTFHYTVIDQINGVIKENAFENFSTMLSALQANKIDGYIAEKPTALSVIISNPEITFVEFDKDNGFSYERNNVNIAIGMKKGNTQLLKEINKALSEIPKETREKLMKNAIETQPNAENEINETLPSTFIEWITYFLTNYWKDFLKGTLLTLYLSLFGTVSGFLIGLIISVLRDKRNVNINSKFSKFIFSIITILSNIYVTVIRGTPMIVQAIIFYYGISQFTGINIPALTSALIVVSFNTGAYITEIIRGGIDSIDIGQYEAAQALGMKHVSIMKNIILPQAIRNTLPSVANEFIINIKDTSVLFSIGVTELYTISRSIVGTHVRYYEVFVITCCIYFILTFTLSNLFKYIEKKIDGNKEYKIVGE